jgi:hypothetical protein
MNDITIIRNDFPMVSQRMRRALSKAIRECADLVASRAKQNIVANNTIDTGNMLNSVYTRFIDQDNYPGNIKFPGLRLPPPQDALEAQINVGAAYAVFIEGGTIRMVSRPFLLPALHSVRPIIAGRIQRAMRQEGL